jgi:hypothetical protein
MSRPAVPFAQQMTFQRLRIGCSAAFSGATGGGGVGQGLPCGVAFVVSALKVAIPAGFGPATHGVEIRSLINEINVLSRSCYIDVASALIFAVKRIQQ